jgi:hypothetical protein
MGAAVCVAGTYSSLAHSVLSGADMNILNPEVSYTPAAKTDVSRTLKRHGFVPPSEDKEMQKKWEFYRTISIRNERKMK